VIKRAGPDYDFNDFIVDADHALWAWGGQGLLRWQNGTWEKLSARNGLPCDTIYNLADDGKGLWWLYMSCGIAVLSKAELDRWSAHTDGVTITPTRFLTFADGAHGALNDLRANSALSRDGRIWFANSAPIQTIDTEHLPINTVPPPVLIEQIVADRSPHRAQASLSLPALTRDLEIDYTALSLVEPQNVRFRYKIAGIDKGWQDVGSRRQAFYMNLGPGRYVFRVIASNNDGVWNEAGDTLEFRILPMFYQTRWFFVLCLAATASLVWIVYLYRVRQVTARLNMRFQERIAERNRIAGELHDTLLQSVQGLILHFQRARNLFSTNPSEAVQRLDVALERAEEAIVEGRNAIHDIRSSNLIETDLEQAFSALGEELIPADQSSQALKIVTEGAAKPLNPAVRDEIYRIVREAMRNAFTHSKSQNIEVEIMYEENLFRVRIRDDGKGIDPAVVDQVSPSGHWGLVGMRERAKRMGGELDVWSEDKAGTEIELTLPGAIAYETTPSDAGFRLFRKITNHAR
jgi:signal transduction histidine kinase